MIKIWYIFVDDKMSCLVLLWVSVWDGLLVRNSMFIFLGICEIICKLIVIIVYVV